MIRSIKIKQETNEGDYHSGSGFLHSPFDCLQYMWDAQCKVSSNSTKPKSFSSCLRKFYFILFHLTIRHTPQESMVWKLTFVITQRNRRKDDVLYGIELRLPPIWKTDLTVWRFCWSRIEFGSRLGLGWSVSCRLLNCTIQNTFTMVIWFSLKCQTTRQVRNPLTNICQVRAHQIHVYCTVSRW